MRPLCLVALAALLAPGLAAQTVPARGADDTFEIATWNLEFFGEPSQGPSDALQLDNVAAVIEQAEIDLWAFQEVVDQTEWSQLVTRLQALGYSGRLGPQVSTSPTFDQKLAFIYNTSVVQVIRTQPILETADYEFGGREPFEMQANVTVDEVSRTVYIINIHAKASTGAEDYNRRQAGAVALKGHIDGRIARGEEVILLGDFNDYLVGSTRGGSVESPYDGFAQDSNYVLASLPLQENFVFTFCRSASCSSGDTRDHLLFTAGLSDVYVAGSTDRYGEVLSGVNNYVSTTSDHIPVLARFSFSMTTAAEDDREGRPVRLLATAPNPSRGAAHLRFHLDAPADVQLDVVDALGRIVASIGGAYGPGTHAVVLDGSALAPGAYTVRLSAGGMLDVGRLVRVR
ncbi:endonuclease/exonuclease/phosphatase family protein [Rubrivirga sp. IMCC43871]|uniref:endonuclease/exonuclease/phosphatase family protein n=1 Tax=Rubrivirga sp. IMCC43871 TaxID=3391575 RepID=UPI00398FC0B9